jgi:anti-anti-sigma regulatory factor
MNSHAAGGPTFMTQTMNYFAVRATSRANIPIVCADLAEWLRGRGAGVICCDVADVEPPDIVTVEMLARLCMTARRHDSVLVVCGAGERLLQLINLLGLDELLLQVGSQCEEREPVDGAEEVC